VIGIVASRLVERFHRPTVLISAPAGEIARGSARSVEGCDISAAIAAQKDLLLNFGGHPMAAGLGILPESIPEFRRALSKTVKRMLGGVRVEPGLQSTAICLCGRSPPGLSRQPGTPGTF
jgi:single-stranded-DNA-specific exonuclease